MKFMSFITPNLASQVALYSVQAGTLLK